MYSVTVKVKFGESVVLHGAEILAIVGTGFSTHQTYMTCSCVYLMFWLP
ncbi:MAG: hypothetical protein IPN61_14400 [Bacteroidetes bacterium]|nr:hypothetical protein [Bacteroidota bacterium]